METFKGRPDTGYKRKDANDFSRQPGSAPRDSQLCFCFFQTPFQSAPDFCVKQSRLDEERFRHQRDPREVTLSQPALPFCQFISGQEQHKAFPRFWAWARSAGNFLIRFPLSPGFNCPSFVPTHTPTAPRAQARGAFYTSSPTHNHGGTSSKTHLYNPPAPFPGGISLQSTGE